MDNTASVYSADEALKKLKDGNKHFVGSETGSGDLSFALRKNTFEHGQAPYAVIITCSDSRVMPECIFNAGIGELFVIRVAGNVIGNHQLGSIEYATQHLGCRLIVVMGHERCGAVSAAVNRDSEGYIKFITDEIQKAIGDETDDYKACCLNVRHCIEVIENSLEIRKEEASSGIKVCGAVYKLKDGKVEFL